MATYVMWQPKGQQMGEAQFGAHLKGENVWSQMEKKDDWASKQSSSYSWPYIRPQTCMMHIWKQIQKDVGKKNGHVISLKWYFEIDLHPFLQVVQKGVHMMPPLQEEC